MADSGFLSDTDEDSAVEQLICQAKELTVLEQVAAINCSGFTDLLLPCELEQRFRKLKSFPASNSVTRDRNLLHHRSKSELKNPVKSSDKPEQNPDGKIDLETEKSTAYGSSSVKLSTEDEIFSDPEKKGERKINFKEKSKDPLDYPNIEDLILSGTNHSKSKSKSKSKSFSSSLSSPDSWMDPPSPPKKAGCFFCSPKSKSKKKKSMKNGIVVGSGLEREDMNDEFLSDLSEFSLKKQQKMLKKAIKEEEKVSREAENIVEWAKQASMRLSVHHHDIEDDLSDG